MIPVFNSTLALTLLAHPFQLALMLVTLGALVREGIGALVGRQGDVIEKTRVAVANVPAAA